MVSIQELEKKVKELSKRIKEKSKGPFNHDRIVSELCDALKRDDIEAEKNKEFSQRSGDSLMADLFVEDVAVIQIKDKDCGSQDSGQGMKLKQEAKLPLMIVTFGNQDEPQVKTM